jgi:hypothetical protein
MQRYPKYATPRSTIWQSLPLRRLLISGTKSQGRLGSSVPSVKNSTQFASEFEKSRYARSSCDLSGELLEVEAIDARKALIVSSEIERSPRSAARNSSGRRTDRASKSNRRLWQ